MSAENVWPDQSRPANPADASNDHLTHWDAGVRAVIEREVAKERERIADAIEAMCDDDPRYPRWTTANHAYATAARIAREAGQS